MSGYYLPDDVAECKCGNPMLYYAERCEIEKRYTFHWFDEELEGNDGPITEQLYALIMGWA